MVFIVAHRLHAVATAQAKDVLTIPQKDKTTGQFVFDDWLNNDNAKWHPPSFRKFYFYNITNTGRPSSLLASSAMNSNSTCKSPAS